MMSPADSSPTIRRLSLESTTGRRSRLTCDQRPIASLSRSFSVRIGTSAYITSLARRVWAESGLVNGTARSPRVIAPTSRPSSPTTKISLRPSSSILFITAPTDSSSLMGVALARIRSRTSIVSITSSSIRPPSRTPFSTSGSV